MVLQCRTVKQCWHARHHDAALWTPLRPQATQCEDHGEMGIDATRRGDFEIASSPARTFRMRGRDGVCTLTLHDGSSQAISLPVNSHVII